ncbi:hypothetical protein [Aquimarina sp. I32.4]|nr:hypothetical protein [Aquimarina sp. I32.4]
MLAEFKALKAQDFEYYDVDPSLPFPPPVNDYADGSWTECRIQEC